MSRKAKVYNNGVLAGILEKSDDGQFFFSYDEDYISRSDTSSISLSLPKASSPYQSQSLFPFFFGLLSEGVNKQTQCRLLRIDENDYFSLLLKTASTDTIGAITVKEIDT